MIDVIFEGLLMAAVAIGLLILGSLFFIGFSIMILGHDAFTDEKTVFYNECIFMNGKPRQVDNTLECWYFASDAPKKIMEKQWTPSK